MARSRGELSASSMEKREDDKQQLSLIFDAGACKATLTSHSQDAYASMITTHRPFGTVLLLALFLGGFFVDRRGAATAQSIADQIPPALECFNTTDLEILAACIGNDTLAELGCNTTAGDFEETVNCVNDTINGLVVDVITTLPDCVGSTLNTLGQCALDNRDVCSASCTAVTFDGFDEGMDWTLLTCNQIQQSVLNPLCTSMLSCCSTCVLAFEAFSECLVNDLISVSPFQECEFECTGDERQRGRELLFLIRETMERSLSSSNTATSTGFPERSILDCGNKDLIDRPNTLETVGEALGCATEEFLEIIKQEVEDVADIMPSASPTDSSAAVTYHGDRSSLLAAMPFIALFVQLSFR
jgi:hypothetical protein